MSSVRHQAWNNEEHGTSVATTFTTSQLRKHTFGQHGRLRKESGTFKQARTSWGQHLAVITRSRAFLSLYGGEAKMVLDRA